MSPSFSQPHRTLSYIIGCSYAAKPYHTPLDANTCPSLRGSYTGFILSVNLLLGGLQALSSHSMQVSITSSCMLSRPSNKVTCALQQLAINIACEAQHTGCEEYMTEEEKEDMYLCIKISKFLQTVKAKHYTLEYEEDKHMLTINYNTLHVKTDTPFIAIGCNKYNNILISIYGFMPNLL
jgi:hypothetical protein